MLGLVLVLVLVPGLVLVLGLGLVLVLLMLLVLASESVLLPMLLEPPLQLEPLAPLRLSLSLSLVDEPAKEAPKEGQERDALVVLAL